MIWFLIFYWFFTGLFTFGFAKCNEEIITGRSQVACFIASIFVGGIFFPIFLGTLFSKIWNKLDEQ